jgi:plastocyanin
MKSFPSVFRLTVILVLFSLLAVSAYAKKWVVNVQNNSFFPFNLTHVKAGDTIQWVWVEGVHSTTSTEIPEGALDWDEPVTQQQPSVMIRPMVNGTYWYVSTPDSSSGMKGTFIVSGALGISSAGETPGIRLFPNPAADHINISAGNENIVSLRIFNARGTEVSEQKLLNYTGLSKYSIDLGNYPPGVFFFEFITRSNEKKIFRIVHLSD